MTGCPISLYKSRAWGFCDSSRCGKGVVWIYLIYFFSFSLSLGDTSFRTKNCLKELLNPKPATQSSLDTVMVNGYTFRGSNSVSLVVASHTNWGHLIKERICSHWSKFFPLRVDPILGRLYPPGKQTGSQENCLPLKTC